MRLLLRLVVGCFLVVLVVLAVSPRARFFFGGALTELGYAAQDPIHSYDFQERDDEITPSQVWRELQAQNTAASSVRNMFHRSTLHPLVAFLVCMDARIDTHELAGDTRREYYVVRTAGSIVDAEEAEMLELAVANGVKVIVLTRHTDCAAEKAAQDPQAREKYPALTASVMARDEHIKRFIERPVIAEKIKRGELLVEDMLIDTATGALRPLDGPPTAHNAP